MNTLNEINNNEIIENNLIKKKPQLLFSTRFLLSIVLFLSYTVQFLQRTNMGIAIVCMVDPQNKNQELAHSPKEQFSFYHLHEDNKSIKKEGTFDWSKATQGFILSSYFYGYILTQIPSGWLAIRYGPKIVLFIAILGASLATLLTPLAATLSVYALVAIRFLTGFFHGLAYPTSSAFFIRWAPPDEKSRLIGFATAGFSFGSVAALFLGGFLCENGFYHGWGSTFILFGSFGLLWLLALIFLTSDSPTEHRFISEHERLFIVKSIPNFNTIKEKSKKTPWLAILTSKPVLAIVICNVFSNWGFYVFLTQTPSYLKDVLKFDIKSNGFYSSVPYIFSLLTINVSSVISDKIIESQVISRTMVRRIFNSIAMFFPMLLVIGLTFVSSSAPVIGVVLITLGVGINCCTAGAGFMVNANEVGGKYAGVLYSISNTLATIPGIIAPYLVGILTKNGTQEEWKVVFYITAAFYFIAGVVFAVYCSSEPQDFEKKDLKENKLNEHETSPLIP